MLTLYYEATITNSLWITVSWLCLIMYIFELSNETSNKASFSNLNIKKKEDYHECTTFQF